MIWSQRKKDRNVKSVCSIIGEDNDVEGENIMEYLKYTPEVAKDWKNGINFSEDI